MKNLYEYFTDGFAKGIMDYRVVVSLNIMGDPQFSIHPDGKEGETLDFKVRGNVLYLILPQQGQ